MWQVIKELKCINVLNKFLHEIVEISLEYLLDILSTLMAILNLYLHYT